MGLIVSSTLYTGYSALENVSNAYMYIPKKYLSLAYDLPTGTLLLGTVLSIGGYNLSNSDIDLFKELIHTDIELYLFPMLLGTNDIAYLSKKSWSKFRDYGILPSDYTLTINIKEIAIHDVKMPIYPKRDLKVTD